jgi:hypothetical protein
VFKQTIKNDFILAIFACLWLLGASLLLPDKIFAGEEEAYAVKAAFILNFAKLTHWPAAALDDSPETLDLCLVGDDAFLRTALQTIDGKEVGERILRVHSIATAADSRGCEILFVGNAIDSAGRFRFLTAAKGRPVLVIGETPGFAGFGGIINFITQEGKLHFEVNLREAERKGLKISSRVLQLATIVGSD